MTTSHPTLTIDREIFKCLEECYGVSVRVFSQALAGFSGDFWGSFRISPYECAIYIADLCGHGAEAARNAAELRSIMGEYIALASSPAHYVTELNIQLGRMLQAHEYATMFYGVINTKKNSLFYTTAANPPVILIKAQGETCLLKQGSGVPLGIDSNVSYSQNEVAYHKGDSLFLYSDALIETKDQHNNYMDSVGLSSVLKEKMNLYQNHSTVLQANAAFNDMVSFVKQTYIPYLDDDLTMALVTRDAV